MAKIKKDNPLPSQEDVFGFAMLYKLADSIYTEMKEFSKKKPDDLLNTFKVKNVNRVLEKLKDFLKNEPTIEFLDLLDEETLPSNSDAILIIGQYKAALDNYRNRNTTKYGRWMTIENPQGKNID
jgi:hypothetical protein